MMNSASPPVKFAAPVLELLFVTAAVWVLRGYEWPDLVNNEVSVIQAHMDPRWFQGDFVVQESMRFTPRFYYNALVLGLARTGLPLAWTFVVWHLAALAGLITGLRSLARGLGMGETAAAVWVVWLLTVGVGTVGDVFFFTHAPVPAVWAGAWIAWGAAMAVRRRYLASFAFFGAAALIQFLVGFYAGILGILALGPATWKQRASALGAWALGLALVYVPMRLGNTTSTAGLDNAAFVEIYAQLRHPHHLVPSTWGWAAWVQAAAFYLGAWWVMVRARGRGAGREGAGAEAIVFHASLALAAAALAVNYVGVEVHPLALVAKLQPARMTPLVQGIALTLLALRLQAFIERREFLLAGLLAIIPFTALPGLLLVLFAVLAAGRDSQLRWPRLVLAAAVLMAFQPFDPSLPARAVRYGLWAGLVAAQLVPAWLGRRPKALAASAALAVAVAGSCAYASLQPGWPPFLTVRFAIDARPLDAPGILGRRFAAVAPPGAIVLLPPAGETWSFRLQSHRAAVVDDKDFPFTDAGIREWKNRMDAVLGTPLVRGLDLVEAWHRRPPEDVLATARLYGARYILTRDDWHPRLPGRLVDREQGWTLWEEP